MSAAQDLIKQAVITSIDDPGYFCRFFLRHWFPTPMPPLHLGLAALVTRKVAWLEKPEYRDAWPFLLEHFRYPVDPEDRESQMLPIFQVDSNDHLIMVAGRNNEFVIPRGFSKTTLLNALNLHEVVTDTNTFVVYISESATHAETQLSNIRAELESNSLLREAYGNVVPTRGDSERWTGKELQLLTGPVLVARGRGSQIRGINFRGRRPNKILLDDVEDKESVSTADQRKKTVDWFYSSVLPAGNEMSGADPLSGQDKLQITILGTLLGPETLITEVSQDPTFSTVRFGAKLRDGHENLKDREMLWPYKLNAADYLKKRAQYARVGQLSGFSLEYDSTVSNEEDAKFQKSMFIYEPAPTSLAHVSIALDPAISDTPGRDHTAMVATGRAQNGVLYVLETWGGLGKTPREKIDAFFSLHLLLTGLYPNARHSRGIEAQAYQKALIYLMREEMAKKQLFFHIESIFQGPDLRKEERILGILSPRYSNGYMRHTRRFPHLETQLMDFPNGKKDYADAAAMSLTLLGESSMLAAPPDSKVTQDQFEALDSALPPLYSGTHIFQHQSPIGGGRYG